jgi:hypothetical protein
VEEELDGIAAADARLGRSFPLPLAALPLVRWTTIRAVGEGGAEVEWALDDSRPGSPARLVLYAGSQPPPQHAVAWDGPAQTVGLAAGVKASLRTAALAHAQASLRPVRELGWRSGGLHLRLTAQGPWRQGALVAIAASVDAGSG